MSLVLYGHPFSSYTQKALIALYENDLAFDFRVLSSENPGNSAEWAGLWPLKRFPVLVDEGEVIAESSIIIEHLARHHRGPVALLPADADAALEIRFLDRFFDNYVMNVMMVPVFEAIRPDSSRKEETRREAAAALDIAYAWLETKLAGRQWAAGDSFTMADCAAAPSLFYADWVHRIGNFPNLRAYRSRLLARPSFARCVEDARPSRHLFPLGAPDRD